MDIFDVIHLVGGLSIIIPLLIVMFCWRRSSVRKEILESNIQYKNASPNAIIISDAEGRIVDSNEKAGHLFGYTSEEFSKLRVEDLIPEEYRDHHVRVRNNFQNAPTERPLGIGRDLQGLTKDGRTIPVEVSVGNVFHNNRQYVMAGIVDISERQATEETIYRLAYYDSLTNLPNRESFNTHANVVLQRAQANKSRFAFFLVDLDGFKKVNDTLGHDTGDAVLYEIAFRLSNVIERRCDNEQDCRCFAARLGGDEFVLIFERLSTMDQIDSLAEDIYGEFSVPFYVNGHEIHSNLSVGVSVYPTDGENVSSLLKSADLALYEAKNKGKNQYVRHTPDMNTAMETQAHYEHLLRDMVDNDSFELAFQPIIDLNNDFITGAEVLFRSRTQPFDAEQAIRVAEETGLIVPLGKKIMKRACELYNIHGLNERGYCLSVNASMKELDGENFTDTIFEILEETNFLPQNLSLEVTETLIMKNRRSSFEKLSVLSDRGIQISIDDFGKGYSSMSQLQHLPFSKLKIDKSFVDLLLVDVKSKEIVKGITQMAHSIGMVVCVEGVETNKQMSVIRRNHIDLAQGYLISHPIPFEQYLEMLKEETR